MENDGWLIREAKIVVFVESPNSVWYVSFVLIYSKF